MSVKEKKPRFNPGIRIVLFLVVMAAVIPAIHFIPIPKHLNPAGITRELINTAVFILVCWLYLQWADRGRFKNLRLGIGKTAAKSIALGVGISVLVIFSTLMLEITAGRIKIILSFHPTETQRYPVWLLMGTIFLQVIQEEVSFRGYLYPRFCEALGNTVGSISCAVLFGFIHLATIKDATLVTVMTIIVYALLLQWLFVRTGSLWAPIGIHWGINFTQFLIYKSVIFPVESFKTWLGGTPGYESSPLSLIIGCFACLVAWAWSHWREKRSFFEIQF